MGLAARSFQGLRQEGSVSVCVSVLSQQCLRHSRCLLTLWDSEYTVTFTPGPMTDTALQCSQAWDSPKRELNLYQFWWRLGLFLPAPTCISTFSTVLMSLCKRVELQEVVWSLEFGPGSPQQLERLSTLLQALKDAILKTPSPLWRYLWNLQTHPISIHHFGWC